MVGGTLAQAVLFIGWLGGWWYTGTSCNVYWVVGWLVVHWHKLYCLLGGWVVGGTLAQAVMFIGWLGGWWYTGTSCTVYWVVGWLVVHWHKL